MMAKHKYLMAFLAILFIIIAFTFSALAQSSELAKGHFEAAKSYYNQGKYDKALEEFEESYRLMPLPEIIYNIAQCYERLGQIDRALEKYKKYIDEKPDAQDIQAVKEKIAGLKEKLDKTGISLSISEDGAKIFVDGYEVGVSPIEGFIKVYPGNHELKIEKEGFKSFTMKFSIAAGSIQSASVTLTPEESGKEIKYEGKVEKGNIVEPKKKVLGAGYYIGYGLSIAIVIGSAVTGGIALDNVGKANDNLNDTEKNDLYSDRAKMLATVTDVLWPAGVAGILGTTIILLIKKPWQEKKQARLKTNFGLCFSELNGGIGSGMSLKF